MVGIYKITNKENGKSYIGQSVQIEIRWKSEINDALNRNGDTKLARAIRKYGIESFDFSVLEECKIEDLDDREMFYIKKYDTYNNGYNMTVGGSNIVRKIDYAEFKKVVEDNFNISDGDLSKMFNVCTKTIYRTRKILNLPKKIYKYEFLLSKIRSLKKEIIDLYNQDFPFERIAKKLGLDTYYLIQVVEQEWKLPKRNHLYRSNIFLLLYDKKDGSFIKKSTKSEMLKTFPKIRFGSLNNGRKSDLGYVIRYYKENYPLVLNKKENGWFEYWGEEG